MSDNNQNKEQAPVRADEEKRVSKERKGSSFNEDHRDIKESDFHKSIAETDPTANKSRESTRSEKGEK